MVDSVVVSEEPEPDIRGLSRTSQKQNEHDHQHQPISNQNPSSNNSDHTILDRTEVDPTINEKDGGDIANALNAGGNSAPIAEKKRKTSAAQILTSLKPGGINSNKKSESLHPTFSAETPEEIRQHARGGDDDPNGKDPEDDKPQFEEPTWGQSFKNMIKASPYLLVIPIILPISWALHFAHQSPVAIFITCLLGVVPLAGGLGFATEELALRVGEAWGGLLNATFGNAVELLIAILALVKGEIDIVQASMIGSILSNVLLVLGMSYFAGGLRFHEQLYATVGSQMHISLLGISLMAIVLPAAYHFAYPSTMQIVDQVIHPTTEPPEGIELDNLLKLSRGLSFILLIVYGMFLTFQLYTHAYLFKIPRERVSHPLPGPAPGSQHVFPKPDWIPSMHDSSSSSSSGSSHTHSGPFKRLRRLSRGRRGSHSSDNDVEGTPMHSPVSEAVHMPPPPMDTDLEAGLTLPPAIRNIEEMRQMEEDEKEAARHRPKVKLWYAVGMLFTMTALAGITAEWLIESIDGLTETSNVSREFVGLILLPVIGNSVEHITAVTVSVKDKLNLSMSIAVGSSIQVSLCLLPVLVLIGWAIGQPMLLFFDTFETITLVISVLLVNFAIADGRTNYLEGFIMMMAYISIALVTWFYDPLV